MDLLGFRNGTSGDKSDDADMLKWLCSKGYVAAGINYTLRTDTNTASVFSQSNEIKAAIPAVIEAAKSGDIPSTKCPWQVATPVMRWP